MSLDRFLNPGDVGDVVVSGRGDNTGPDRCPSPICGRAYDKGTVNDVIGVFGLRTNILLCWKCPFCGHEWNDPEKEGDRLTWAIEKRLEKS